MTAWTSEQLDRIGQAEELRVTSLRPDGSLRSPVIVWVVRHGDDLFIRSVNGPDAAWYRGTRDRHEGRIWAGGVEADVTFIDCAHQFDAELDAAYRSKYRNHAAKDVDAIIRTRAQDTNLTQRTPRRGVILGLACTYAALLGYALMTLSPVEGAHLTLGTFIGFCRSEAPVLIGGVVTGPLFGWFGHRWGVARAWAGALLTATAFCLEPLAHAAVDPGVISSKPVIAAEIAFGVGVLGYVALTMARRPRSVI